MFYTHNTFLEDAARGLTLTEIKDVRGLSEEDLKEVLQDHKQYVERLSPIDALGYLFWNLDYFDEALLCRLGFEDLIGEDFLS